MVGGSSASTRYAPGGYATDGEALSRNQSRTSLSKALGPTAQSISARSKASGRGSGRHQPLSATNERGSGASGAQAMGPVPARAPIVQTTVLRRAHIVVDAPLVKEESIESAPLEGAQSEQVEETGSISLGEGEEVPPRSKGKAKASARGSSQSARRKWFEDKRIYDEDSASGPGSASGSDVDDDYVPPKPSRSRVHEEDDEEDDELNIGGEVRAKLKFRMCFFEMLDILTSVQYRLTQLILSRFRGTLLVLVARRRPIILPH